MKKIEQFLQENGIEYERNRYGNPYYFNDGFSVEGLTIAFYFDGIGNAWESQNLLKNHMKSKKAYVMQSHRFGAGVTYSIFSTFDARRLAEHQEKVRKATGQFWQERHAENITKAKAI